MFLGPEINFLIISNGWQAHAIWAPLEIDNSSGIIFLHLTDLFLWTCFIDINIAQFVTHGKQRLRVGLPSYRKDLAIITFIGLKNAFSSSNIINFGCLVFRTTGKKIPIWAETNFIDISFMFIYSVDFRSRSRVPELYWLSHIFTRADQHAVNGIPFCKCYIISCALERQFRSSRPGVPNPNGFLISAQKLLACKRSTDFFYWFLDYFFQL